MIRTLLENLERQLQAGIYGPRSKAQIARDVVKRMGKKQDLIKFRMIADSCNQRLQRGIYG